MVTYALFLRAMSTLHEKVSLHMCKSNSAVPTRGSEASLLWARETQNECLTPLLGLLELVDLSVMFGPLRPPQASRVPLAAPSSEGPIATCQSILKRRGSERTSPRLAMPRQAASAWQRHILR